jgi:hypothetical protein
MSGKPPKKANGQDLALAPVKQELFTIETDSILVP